MKKEELYEEYETITIEEAINIMTRNHGDDSSSYIVRDTNGEVVVDSEVIKVVHDAIINSGVSMFEYGGNFKKIKESKNKEVMKNREKHIIGMMKKLEYCQCCGEPILEDS